MLGIASPAEPVPAFTALHRPIQLIAKALHRSVSESSNGTMF